MGHQDVVPASDEGWSVPAYSGAIVDGKVYGRGALDCKSTMLGEMQAVEELLAEGFVPPCDVYLEYSINEETGGDGAAAANVIPKEPYLVANLRTSVHQSCEASLAVMQKYAKKHDLEIEVLMQRDASPVSNIHSKEYTYVVDCVKKQFPDVGIAPYVIMGGTDCRHFHALTENALRFAPVRMTTAQSASCHAVDENATVEALAEGVRFFKMFLKEYPL